MITSSASKGQVNVKGAVTTHAQIMLLATEKFNNFNQC